MQTYLGIPDGVYVDSVAGIAGTTYPIGTSFRPVDNLTDALAIAAERNLNTIYIRDVTAGLLLPTDLAYDYHFIGRGVQWGDYLDCNSHDAGVYCKGFTVTGITTRTIYLVEGAIESFTGEIDAKDCILSNMAVPSGTIKLHNCTGVDSSPSIDFTGNINSWSDIEFSGTLTLQNVDSGAGINVYGKGLELIIAASCTNGTINVYGNTRIINNSAGVTVNDYTEDTEVAWQDSDGVYVDSVSGEALATHSWAAGYSPIGLSSMPVDNLTDAIAIAAVRNTNVFHIMQGGHNLPADLTKVYTFYGHGENTGINMNNKNTNYARFHNLDVNGISTGAFTCYKCQITNITGSGPNLYGCTYYGTVISDGEYIFRADFAEATLDLTGAPYVIVNHASGILELKNMTAGDIWIHGEGLKLTIAATCTGGTINIYGSVRVTDNSVGATVNIYTAEESADILQDGVFVLSTSGLSGTAWPLGTAQKPVDNLTDALAIAAARNLENIYIQDDSGHALPAGVTWPMFIVGRQSYYDSLDLNGQTLGCSFKNLVVWGAFLGIANFEDCYLTSVSGPSTAILRCEIESIGPITTGLIVHQSWGERSTAEIDLTGNAGTDNVVEMSGQVTIKGVNQVACVVNVIGRNLALTIDATCTNGTINVYGSARITDNSAGSTVNILTTEESADILPDGVYVNSNTGSAGTAWPLGTAQKPVDNLANALTIMAARNLKNIFIRDDTGLALPSDCNNYEHFFGRDRDYDFLDVNNKALDCFMKNLGIWGTFTGSLACEDCQMDGLDGASLYALRCEIYRIGPITQHLHIYQSWASKGGAASYIDMAGLANSPNYIEMTGEITLKNVNQVTNVVDIVGHDLVLTLDATCTAGTINIYGSTKVIDNSGGSTVNDWSNETTILSATWDTIFFDSNNGEAGTALPIGSAARPVDNHNDLMTILATRPGVTKISISGSLTLVAGDTFPSGIRFEGKNPYDDELIIPASLSLDATIKNLYVDSTAGDNNCLAGSQIFDCMVTGEMGGVMFWNCVFMGGNWRNGVFVYGGYFDEENEDFTGSTATHYILGARGNLILKNITAAATIKIYGEGVRVTVDATCTAGTVDIYGESLLEGTANGSTINYDIDSNYPIPSSALTGLSSLYDIAQRAGGRILLKSINLTAGAGANNTANLFSFTGPYRLKRLYAILIDVTDIADFEDVGFELFDGANIVQLNSRDPGGPVLDGYSNYSLLITIGNSGVALGALNADQVRIDETLPNQSFEPYIVNPKAGATNYLRIAYDSLSIDVTLVAFLVYEELTGPTTRVSGLAAV